jgi:hypothetical protein
MFKMKLNKIFLILGIVAVITLLSFIIVNQVNANAIKEKQDTENYTEWLASNCKCLERGRVSCPFGFELKNDTCTYGTYYTNKLLDCSKYDCSGEIKSWDDITEKWK